MQLISWNGPKLWQYRPGFENKSAAMRKLEIDRRTRDMASHIRALATGVQVISDDAGQRPREHRQ